MNSKNLNMKDNPNYNLNIIKDLTITPQELSVQITPSEDIKQVKNESVKYDSYNTSNISQNNEEKLSSDEADLSGNNYNSEEYQNIINENENVEEEDKINLIKKQNKKIDELFNLLESRDKEINLLQNENHYLIKFRDDFEMVEKNNFELTNILNN